MQLNNESDSVDSEVLPLSAAATALKVDKSQLARWAKIRTFPRVRVEGEMRFNLVDVRRWIERHVRRRQNETSIDAVLMEIRKADEDHAAIRAQLRDVERAQADALPWQSGTPDDSVSVVREKLKTKLNEVDTRRIQLANQLRTVAEAEVKTREQVLEQTIRAHKAAQLKAERELASVRLHGVEGLLAQVSANVCA